MKYEQPEMLIILWQSNIVTVSGDDLEPDIFG